MTPPHHHKTAFWSLSSWREDGRLYRRSLLIDSYSGHTLWGCTATPEVTMSMEVLNDVTHHFQDFGYHIEPLVPTRDKGTGDTL